MCVGIGETLWALRQAIGHSLQAQVSDLQRDLQQSRGLGSLLQCADDLIELIGDTLEQGAQGLELYGPRGLSIRDASDQVRQKGFFPVFSHQVPDMGLFGRFVSGVEDGGDFISGGL